MPAAFPDFIRIRLERAGADLDSARLSKLAIYFGLLTKWNETVNLTALALNPASEEAIDRILIEPLLAAQAVRSSQGWSRPSSALRLLDVGSGGGSPAIPLAIAFGADGPVELRMVESKVRKSAFLRDAIRQIPLAGAEVFNSRLEELSARSDTEETFDLVSIRAIRVDAQLWSNLIPLVKVGGRILWFRSPGEALAFPQFFALEGCWPLLKGSEVAVLRRTTGAAQRA